MNCAKNLTKITFLIENFQRMCCSQKKRHNTEHFSAVFMYMILPRMDLNGN